ncbi:GtrA family protein [Uliginosibacterium aquaticum]|uniref:GtrA family protein n=1 Tax=Uliginosibacterium aquaticum TaxID=2731212 RepID=A0ABX2IHW1_9RHOO|nr:GtrA family protein [Uliginosibacterium aquaticum]NSL55468.1 GtrA family protein [Uliginosibacterium aquaticum]
MIRAEFPRFLRFCAVGVANTGVHMLIVLTLAELLHWPPPLANAMAFLGANLFSYILNSRWTFATMKGDASRYPRFLAVSLVGLAISWASVELAMLAGLHYLFGVVGSVLLVAVSGYILNRLFVFRH